MCVVEWYGQPVWLALVMVVFLLGVVCCCRFVVVFGEWGCVRGCCVCDVCLVRALGSCGCWFRWWAV